MAGAEDEASDLMSVLGHELRSPLTAIRGASALLLQAHAELSPDKVDELLRVIESQAGRMADRVEDVLVVGRIDGRRLRLYIETVDLGDVVPELLESIRERERGTDRLRLQNLDGVRVIADADRVAQVMRNLIDNAIRFSPSGSPVEIAATPRRGSVRIEVRDRGRGVPAADRSRIFDCFVRLDPSASGAGVGLYVAAGLAEAMGGKVGVSARPGGGSVFWLTLAAPK
ncbi:MAG: hypothetical protein NVS9B1_18060 [Candidatus Dormibacteraceae bacterium]